MSGGKLPEYMSSSSTNNLDALKTLLSATDLPPVHLWHPDIERDINMRIARNGDWFYNGSIIARKRMVKLFSTVLRVDDDGETYLVTPVEKLRIQVDDAPFTAVLLHKEGTDTNQGLVLTTNTGDKVLAGEQHPIFVEYKRAGGEPSPYIVVRDKLRALISRSVFIELADLATTLEDGTIGVFSDGCFMPLAQR